MNKNNTRLVGFLVLIITFVVVVLIAELYAVETDNQHLIDKILSQLGTIVVLMLGYYFGKK